ncbi:MAG: hypothetical protein IPI66_06555 [Chitinophagaceae bacterium]|nr:hypothetical protein [Chitinophagaceae bacterium]MBL0055976.1 hypothetical protein [Chitinophagaceae bacterium]
MRAFLIILSCMAVSVVYAQKAELVYRSKTDSSQNYYKILLPEGVSKGLLVILGGFCTTPEEVMLETKLPLVASKAGYTVLMPYLINDCDSIDTKNIHHAELAKLILEVMNKYPVPENKFILGGQSLGGHRALYYAEQAFKANKDQMIRPNGVFGVDPPLNMKRLWYSFARGVKANFSEVSVGEGTEMMRRFRIMYGGSPEQKPKKYEEASSFFPDAADGGNARYLKNIPVRLYCDPDINWIIENRRGSYETMNATDLSGCISQLKLLGNRQAEFVNCLGKGFKPDGSRHPHYFSMLDPEEFVSWADKILNNQ